MIENLRPRLPRRSARGGSTVAYGLVLAVVVFVSSGISGVVGDRTGEELEDRGSRVGNPDQFVAPVVVPGDGGGYSGDDESPSAPTSTTVAIADLGGDTSIGNGNKWTASVTVTVETVTGHTPIGGAEVSGFWSHGMVATSCSTDSSGTCVVTQSGLKLVGDGTVAESTFTVYDIFGDDLVYDAASNDPDPPEITLLRP